jgi:hypothetical protein
MTIVSRASLRSAGAFWMSCVWPNAIGAPWASRGLWSRRMCHEARDLPAPYDALREGHSRMIWEKLLTALVELLTKGWPFAALVIVYTLRRPLSRSIDRIQDINGWGGKLHFRDSKAAADEASRLESAPKQDKQETKQLSGVAGSVSTSTGTLTVQPAAKVPDAPKPPANNAWCKCGHVYWLGHNINYAALALGNGRLVDALREFDNAMFHAKQVPLALELVVMLRDIEKQDWSHRGAWPFLIKELVDVGILIGIFITEQDPNYLEKDVQKR